jgi:TrmH family RNA methyltransferase
MKLPRFLVEPPNANILVVLDRISDPGNLGTFFRTALWFGVRDFVLDERTADPFNEKAVRASMGAVGGVRIHRSGDIVRTLHAIRENGCALIAADPRGKPVQSFGFPGKCALIFGNEAHGLAPSILALADHRVCIPGSGPVDSLNVTVAGGILLGAATGYASRDQKPLCSA